MRDFQHLPGEINPMDIKEHGHKFLLSAYRRLSMPYRHWANARNFRLGKAPIMVRFYHRIADDKANAMTHSNKLFRKQIHWLKKHCEMISLEEAQRRIRSGYNDRLAASITFDDGYAENCDQAIPLLMEENIP